ncbi:MAG: response regulator [Candidatus Omnitrophica bacterium]|nr:response regulator [Candidatus Omnitrophota bacterium]
MSKKILVIDDDPGILGVIKARLEACEFEVVTALDGDEGLRMIPQEKPKLIITDVMMPNMDGYSLILEIKRLEEAKDVPVIVLTAKEMMEDLFKLEGVVDYIVKPFESGKLVAAVKKHFPE